MARKKKQDKVEAVKPTSLKLDLGCGPNKKEGFFGVDIISFPNVDLVFDLKQPWPWEDNSVEEVHTSHFIEHLDANERIHFVNELYRVLKMEGKATMIAPHWASCRAYGDPTHKWPPISEFWFYYLQKEWRLANAPHDDFATCGYGYKCDFDVTWGYSLHPDVIPRNQEYQMIAMTFYKEACQDILATLVKNR
jgi:hypothetical protein